MERQMYQPTEKQEEKWSKLSMEMPSDDEIKALWKKSHHGVESGWGMLKRQYATQIMQTSREYQIGLWQGKLDKCNGLEYSEERNENTYNLGYYRGYNENIHGYINDVIRVNPNFKHLEESK